MGLLHSAFAQESSQSSLESWHYEMIIHAMRDSSKSTRHAALDLLARERHAVPIPAILLKQVTDTLQDEDASMREAAIKALKAMGSAGAAYAHMVADKLSDKRSVVRIAAAEVLRAIRPVDAAYIHDLVELLKDQDKKVRAAAVKALGAMKPKEAEIIRQMAGLLKDGSESVRDAACEAFAALGPAGAAHAQEVAKLLKDKHKIIRAAAVEALGAMKPKEVEIIRQMAGLLKDEYGLVRAAASKAFAALGPVGVAYAEEMAELLDDQDAFVRAAAIKALGEMRPAGANHAAKVAKLLEDKDDLVRAAAIVVLTTMRPSDTQLAHQAIAFLNDRSQYVQDAAVWVLGVVGQKKVHIQEIRELLKVEDINVRNGLVSALGALGRRDPSGEHYARQVANFLKDNNVSVRGTSIEVLGAMGANGARYAQQVAALLNDQNAFIRAAAAKALGAMGANGARYAQQVAALLNDESGHVKRSAVEALGAMGADGARYAQQVAALLNDESGHVKRSAVKALGAMGADGARHAEKVVALLKDNEPDLITAAARVLQSLSGRLDTHARRKARFPCLEAVIEVQCPKVVMESQLEGDIRLACYLLGPLTQEENFFIAQTHGNRSVRTNSMNSLSKTQIGGLLKYYSEAWQSADGSTRVKQAIANQVSELAHHRIASLSWQQVVELKKWQYTFSRDYAAEASLISEAVRRHEYYKLLHSLGLSLAFVAFYTSVLGWVYAFRPHWLLALYEWGHDLADVLPERLRGPTRLGLMWLLLGLILRERVLDAWVHDKAKVWYERLHEMESEPFERYYIPLPILVHDPRKTVYKQIEERVETPSPGNLGRWFGPDARAVHIVAVGGSGKTTLAMQLCRWMLHNEAPLGGVCRLPIWLDRNIDESSLLVAEVDARIKTLLDGKKLNPMLRDALLAHGRIVLVADRLSELSTHTQRLVGTFHQHWPRGLLVVTARFMSQDGRRSTLIKPLPLQQASVITGLIEREMEHLARHKGVAITPYRVSEVAHAFNGLVAGAISQEDNGVKAFVTPLLVNLYVQSALRLMQTNEPLTGLPTSIPKIYDEYVDGLLRTVMQGTKFTVHALKKAVYDLAETALGDRYAPGSFMLNQLMQARQTHTGYDPLADREVYDLLVNAGLLWMNPIGDNPQLRFVLDPVAEYLAAYRAAGRCCSDLKCWQELRDRLASDTDARGFAIALFHVHQYHWVEAGWPPPQQIFGWESQKTPPAVHMNA
ncbi:MAG: HEAT repeat domain-containing protein [Gemmatales bacterium]|nr:HEAT repeat domain-containing protein [Gemmatales bacterium]